MCDLLQECDWRNVIYWNTPSYISLLWSSSQNSVDWVVRTTHIGLFHFLTIHCYGWKFLDHILRPLSRWANSLKSRECSKRFQSPEGISPLPLHYLCQSIYRGRGSKDLAYKFLKLWTKISPQKNIVHYELSRYQHVTTIIQIEIILPIIIPNY